MKLRSSAPIASSRLAVPYVSARGLTSLSRPLVPSATSVTPRSLSTARPLSAVFRTYSNGPEVTVQVPGMGDSISEGTISEWLKKPGDPVAADEVVCVLETDKVQVDVRSPDSGTFVRALADAQTDVRVGQDLFVITKGAAVAAAAAAPAAKAAPAPATAAPTPSKPAPQAAPPAPAPAKAASAPTPAPAARGPAPPAPAPPRTSAPGSREERRVKMTKMRQRISQRLKESQETAAMLTTFNEIDMHNLIEMRNKHKDEFEKKHGVKLGFMSPFIKAASTALAEFPIINAVIDGTEILYRDYHDISVAVASPTGLVVPVLRNVEAMGFADVEKAIALYSNKAKDGSLAIEDMAGGTFTISNGGTYGSLFGTPIINPPQSAILGMHATNPRAHVVDGEIKVRPVMFVALTYDHRLIDGREAVLFLKKIKSCIENPERMLFNL